MSGLSYSEYDPTIPIWKFGDDGRASLARPTSYFQDSMSEYKRGETRAIYGVIVKNRQGVHHTMSLLQHNRMKSLFELGHLEVVEYLKAPHLSPETAMKLALSGYDTEGTMAVIG